jgi:hypothetical protein
MRWVLFRAPEEEDTDDEMREEASLRSFVKAADDVTRGLLAVVAKATLEDSPLRLTDVADELEQDANAVRASVRIMNAQALGRARPLVKILNETAVGVHGNRGKVSFLTMRPEHARIVRSAVKAPDPA